MDFHPTAWYLGDRFHFVWDFDATLSSVCLNCIKQNQTLTAVTCNSFFLSACPWGENCVHWSVFFLIGFCFFLKCTCFSPFILQKRKQRMVPYMWREMMKVKKISKGNQSWPRRLTNQFQWICSTCQARSIHNGTYGILNILIHESIFRK